MESQLLLHPEIRAHLFFCQQRRCLHGVILCIPASFVPLSPASTRADTCARTCALMLVLARSHVQHQFSQAFFLVSCRVHAAAEHTLGRGT